MIPAALTAALVFAGAAGTLAIAAVHGRRATARVAVAWCAAAYLTTAITVIAGAIHA